MEIFDIIIKVGAVAAALAAIISLIVLIVKFVKKIYTFLHTISADVNTLVKHDKAQYLAILRLTVTADHMPVSERLLAGKEYIEEGGNGEVKKIYLALKEQCEQALEE